MKGANLFLRGYTLWKIKIEPEKPENDGLEDEVPFPGVACILRFQPLILGCNINTKRGSKGSTRFS